MYAVDDIETVHLYVVRETSKQPYMLVPLLFGIVCLLGIAGITLYSAQHPHYEHARLTVPAIPLPVQTLTAEAPIIPTGIKTYPATYASGTLTLTNGSVLSEVLPAGIIFSGSSGVEVITTTAVLIPAGSASGYGVATVAAKAVTAGARGNIPALAVNAVYGTALYIRNLSSFTGGKDGYSVSYATVQDTQTALNTARTLLAARIRSGYHYPCSEQISGALTVTWRCQFVTYRVPSYMHVTAVHLVGKNLIVSVWFIAPQKRIGVK